MNNSTLFRSWKEIAAYLGVDQRTCHRWEKSLNLPVHRIEGGGKGSVFAYKDELDGWILERSGQNARAEQNGKSDGQAKGNNRKPLPLSVPQEELSRLVRGRFFPQILLPRRTRRILIAWHAFLFVLVAAAVFLLKVKPMSRVPHDFRVDGQDFVVVNPKGQEIWRKDTGLRDLLGQDYYERHFQVRRADEQERPILPMVAFKDLDRNGRQEVLFALKSADEMNEGQLICYEGDGEERWRFKVGRGQEFGGQVYSADYRIAGFDYYDLDGNGDLEVLVLAYHKPDWPCQFVVLDSRGKVLGEYWNAGQWNDFQVVDLNGDGRPEILGAGVNNEYGCVFLALIDPSHVSGMSPQLRKDYRSAGIGRGSEKFYVLLPRVAFIGPEEPVESATSAVISENKDISVRLSMSGLYVHFDRSLKFQHVMSSHTFERQVNLLLAEKKIPAPLPADFLETLGKNVRYWDGEKGEWTNRWAMSNKW